MNETVVLFLSRRNLLTLLSKLDGVKAGEASKCTLLKKDTLHPKFPQSHKLISVTAVEDEDYYVDRSPGYIRESDATRIGQEA